MKSIVSIFLSPWLCGQWCYQTVSLPTLQTFTVAAVAHCSIICLFIISHTDRKMCHSWILWLMWLKHSHSVMPKLGKWTPHRPRGSVQAPGRYLCLPLLQDLLKLSLLVAPLWPQLLVGSQMWKANRKEMSMKRTSSLRSTTCPSVSNQLDS